MLFAVDNQFKIIAITQPFVVADEVARIQLMLEEGISLVHIRKPEFTKDQHRALLSEIPQRSHNRIAIHDHHELILEFPDIRLHLNGRNPRLLHKCNGYSCGCHSISELQGNKDADYQFLSPIFNSISKVGYESRFPTEQLREASENGLITSRVIALGGIQSENMEYIANLGFGGAALLGFFWEGLHEGEEGDRDLRKRINEVLNSVRN